eukprot:TRINITY_DN24702_c0_g1_i1.p1 TRINITY_DN24702_c0_g1~~TRINITY_DN24702_c0_g1_i1.p1  ORF type:complete len:742 (+),score=243.12 TRINITY_DN24702_c0_g1_i1:82-2226(+)
MAEAVDPAQGRTQMPAEDQPAAAAGVETPPTFKAPTGKLFPPARDGCLVHEAHVAELHHGSLLAEKRHKLQEAMQEAGGWLSNVDSADTVPVQPVSHAQFVADWELVVPFGTLYDPSAEASVESIDEVSQTLQDLKDGCSNEERLRIFRNFIDVLRHKAGEQRALATTGQLDTTPLTAPAAASLRLLRDFVNERLPALETSLIDSELAAAEKRIAAAQGEIDAREHLWRTGELLRRRAESEEEARDQGVAGGADDGEGTQLERHRWVTERFTALFELHDRRLFLLRQKNVALRKLADYNTAYKARTAAVTAKAMEEVERLRAGVEDEINRCHADIASVDERCAVERTRDEECTRDFEEWRRLSDERLERNAADQNGCWARLAEVEAELAALGQQRRAEVELRCDRSHEEVTRHCNLHERLTRAAAHRRLLQNQVHNAQLALSLLHFTQSSVVSGVDKGVTAQRKNAKHQLREIQLKTRQDELAAFRNLYHSIGDLVQRKEIYASRLQSGMSQSWQLTMLYSEMHTQLREHIDALRDRQRAACADFTPTEQALREARVEFAHPQNEAAGAEMCRAREAFREMERRGVEHIEAVRLEIALHRAGRSAREPSKRRLSPRAGAAASSFPAARQSAATARGLPTVAQPSNAAVLAPHPRLPGSPPGALGVHLPESVLPDIDSGDDSPARGRRLVPAAPPAPARYRRPQTAPLDAQPPPP